MAPVQFVCEGRGRWRSAAAGQWHGQVVEAAVVNGKTVGKPKSPKHG
ncbi:MAG: hypothetical protein ABI781_00520 [Burkholderiales bacterium]